VRPPSSALTAPRRALLGPADVEDDELAAFAAAGLGVRRATVLTSSAEVFPYDLPGLETACLPAYVAGIHAEGGAASLAQVRRTHAALLTIFSALPSVPLEHLDDEPTPRLRRLSRGRAAVARFALDLLDDTRPRQPAAPHPPGRPHRAGYDAGA
jgi:hypothetical protein